MMERTETNRHLAAILFTDIVGYTAMMQHDEKLAIAAVRRFQTALEQCVPKHRGKIQQYYGDGSLNTFNSATDAVQCAFELQKELLKEPMVPLRTGIHIGEIYSEGDKIFGDGVNLASRIESIGQAGTVLFSRHVYEKIRNHPEFEVRSLGSFEFKNVDDPVEVYALTNTEIRTPDPKSIEGKLKEQKKKSHRTLYLSGVGFVLAMIVVAAIYLYPKDAMTSPEMAQYKSSIAVLPFVNISQNPEEDFLSTGLAEDIRTQLAQIGDLKVISRTSSIRYKDYEESEKPLRTIAKELGVTNILEGTVRRYGNTIKFSVQLIDPKHENVIWAEEFMRELEDVLNVQQDIALIVSSKLKLNLSPELKTRFGNKLNVNPEAYVNYHRGEEKLRQSSGSMEEVEQAKQFFEIAIKADSNFSKAWVGLADAYLEFVFWHRAPDEEVLPHAENAARRALQIDEYLGEAYGVLGAVEMYRHNLQSAEKYLRRSIELSPSYDFAYERLAWVKIFSGQIEEGLDLERRVMQLDPLSTRVKGSLGTAYYMMQRYDEGLEIIQQFLKLYPDDNFLLWSMAYLNAGKGNYRKSIEYLDKRTIGVKTNWVYAYCYSKLGNRAAAQEILDQMVEKQKTGFVPDFMMAAAYNALGHKEEALRHLELAVNSGGEWFFAWGMGSDPMFASLKDDPGFQKIVAKMQTMHMQ